MIVPGPFQPQLLPLKLFFKSSKQAAANSWPEPVELKPIAPAATALGDSTPEKSVAKSFKLLITITSRSRYMPPYFHNVKYLQIGSIYRAYWKWAQALHSVRYGKKLHKNVKNNILWVWLLIKLSAKLIFIKLATSFMRWKAVINST